MGAKIMLDVNMGLQSKKKKKKKHPKPQEIANYVITLERSMPHSGAATKNAFNYFSQC